MLTMITRVVAVWLAGALLLAGPLAPVAAAQQAPAAVDPTVPQTMPRRPDAYDVGAGVATVLRAPFNVALCALGGALGLGLFALTLGSGYRPAARIAEEGCGGPWVIRGDDLRPHDDVPRDWEFRSGVDR
jgi:hypothetical protein